MKKKTIKTTFPQKLIIPNYAAILYVSLIVSSLIILGILSLLELFNIKINSDFRLLFVATVVLPVLTVTFYFFSKLFKRRILWIFKNGTLSSPSLKEKITMEDIIEIRIGCKNPNTTESEFQKEFNNSLTNSHHDIYKEVLFIFLKNKQVLVLGLNELNNGNKIMINLKNEWKDKINYEKSPINKRIYIQSYLNKLNSREILFSDLINYQNSEKAERRIRKSIRAFKISNNISKILSVILISITVLCLVELVSRYFFHQGLILKEAKFSQLISFPLSILVVFVIMLIKKILKRN